MCEKDVRFQEQVQKHEEELLRLTAQSQVDSGLQQVRDSATLHQVVMLLITDPHKLHNSQ